MDSKLQRRHARQRSGRRRPSAWCAADEVWDRCRELIRLGLGPGACRRAFSKLFSDPVSGVPTSGSPTSTAPATKGCVGIDCHREVRDVHLGEQAGLLRRPAEPDFRNARITKQLSRCCRHFQLFQQPHRIVAFRATHRRVRTQADTHCGALRFSEQPTAEIRKQLHARNARRFAVGHARDGRRDGRRDATCAALLTAVHAQKLLVPRAIRKFAET